MDGKEQIQQALPTQKKKTKKLSMHAGPTDQKGKRWRPEQPKPIGLHGKKYPHFEKAHQV